MIVVLNNKCNFTKLAFLDYQESLHNLKTSAKLIICPSSPYLSLFTSKSIILGSQNVSSYDIGPHTGEVSASQLKSLGVKFCLVGHSERRIEEGETLNSINSKIRMLLANKIVPILCIGEQKDERLSNRYLTILMKELTSALQGLSPIEKAQVIIAYEPIWSIGTGIIPTKEQITEVFINLKKMLPQNKLLYGGSANNANVAVLKTISIIDGYLLGGLSLDPKNLQIFLNNLNS